MSLPLSLGEVAEFPRRRRAGLLGPAGWMLLAAIALLAVASLLGVLHDA